MVTSNIYLNFNGNCEEAFNFYKAAIGGDFNYFSRFGEITESENYKVPEGDKDKVMHVGLPIGNSVLMGSDCGESFSQFFVQGNNFSVSVSVESREEADRLFFSLSKDGKVTMPMNNTFWGEYFGMFTDKFGINWMISFSFQG